MIPPDKSYLKLLAPFSVLVKNVYYYYYFNYFIMTSFIILLPLLITKKMS